MPRYNPLDIYLDGRWVVSGKVGHINMGNPISLADSITSILGLIPALQANPYNFLNGLTATALVPANTGTNVTLGGLLTQNTTLDGSNTYSIVLDNLANFSWVAENVFTNTTEDWVNTIGGTWTNDVTGSITNESAVQIESSAPIITENVTNVYQVTNNVFDDCNNLIHRISSLEGNSSYQLGSFDGYSAVMRGTFNVESFYNPPALIPVVLESGFYTSDSFNDACVPRSFINAYYMADESLVQLESSSVIEVNPEQTIITVKQIGDVEDRISTINVEANEMEFKVRSNDVDKTTTVTINTGITIEDQDGLNNTLYKLPYLENPNEGEMILMDSTSKGSFVRYEQTVVTGKVSVLAAGVQVPIPVHFDPQVRFIYYLDRVMISGYTGVDGDTLQFSIQEFDGTTPGSPVSLTLTAATIHGSIPGLFYISTSNSNLNAVEHDSQPTMLLLTVTTATANWSDCNITLTFKLKIR